MVTTPRVPPPDHSIHLQQKNRMKRRVMGTLVAVALVFYFFVFPQALVDRMMDMVADRPVSWLGVLAGAGGNVTFVLVLSFVLFASDSAFRGANKSARWARSLYASQAAIERLRCSPGEAGALWFKYFDTWGIEGSPNRNLLINSYAATYAARAIFYLQRALALFVALTLVSMLLHWRIFAAYEGPNGVDQLLIHGLAVVLFAVAWGLLVWTNRIGDTNEEEQATGCWAKVEDVFGRSRALFEHEVLKGVTTVAQGFARVDEIRDDLLSQRHPPTVAP